MNPKAQVTHLQKEYRRIFQDYEALANVPEGVKPSDEWQNTMEWLETRLAAIETRINTLMDLKSA